MSSSTGAARPQAAVVGAGVAGLTAAYLLQRAYDVTLYEADDRLGGHAHTHDIVTGDGRLVSLDTGFIVHNAHAYPRLLRLFGELGVVRTRPVRRAFHYSSYLWLVDLDDLPRIPVALQPLAGFRAHDHLGDPGAPIRANLDRYLARHGIELAGGRVLMLAHARVLGHIFNPLTVFWCHGRDGTLAAVVVVEVHNTYRQRHAYVLHPDPAGRASVGKDFYVSPFLPVAGQYRMRLPEPAGSLRIAVTLEVAGQPVLAATVTGRRHPYTPGRLLACALRYPWVTAQVSALIRWQGIRLLADRHRVIRRPPHYPQEGVQ